MIRKFNYTGRKKIKQDRINITILDGRPYKSFDASVNLEGLFFPEDARIYIEPYHKSSYMRFDCGTVSNFKLPEDRALTDIPPTTLMRFRIKIVDESQKIGRILSTAAVGPKGQIDDGTRQSILPIDWDQDLKQEIFRIVFPEGEGPRLEVNRKLENAREVVKTNQAFRSLVFPIVVRRIAEQILQSTDEFEDGDDSWQSVWLKFFKNTLRANIDNPSKLLDDNEERSIWVDDIVAAFCVRNKVLNRFNSSVKV